MGLQGMENAMMGITSVSLGNTGWLPVLRRRVFFILYPLLKAAFQEPPLSANLEGRDLPVLNHAV
jgi:hypothetical protein